MQIDGKAAIVTGAGTGIGRETALALARGGCSVLVNYSRSQAEAEQTASEVEKLGVQSFPFQADVADDDACREMVQKASQAFGRLNILVNNAGTTRFIPEQDLEEVSDEDWQRIFNVNLLGPFHCARAAKEPMLASGGGEIVNVSSVAALLGQGSSIPYAASKGALNNLTIALARVFAPKIRVNAVAPGFIAGRWLEKGLGKDYQAHKEAFEGRLPLQRVCTPADIADCILSIITGSDMVTGQVLPCDGGMMISKWDVFKKG